MRKWVGLILLCLMAVWIVSALGEDVSSIEMTRRMGNGINLGNTLEACNNGAQFGNTTDDVSYYETMWGQPVTTKEMVQGMKKAGFDTLRIPVAWMTNATHLNQGDYTISEAYLDRVQEIVSWALDADMYVIVNDHWDGGWWGMFGSESEETRNLAMEAYIGMWTQIAERFQDVGDHLIFESANEELGDRFDEDSPLYCHDSLITRLDEQQRYDLTNRINQTFVDTIRAAGGRNTDRFLLIAGYSTNVSKTSNPHFRMPQDTASDKLLISVHCYTPTTYCLAANAAGATPWGTKKDLQDLQAELKMMTKFSQQGIGVVIGEYGALPGADGIMKENAVGYHRFFLDLCDAYGYCPVLWDTSGFYIRKSLAITDADMAALYDSRRFEREGTAEEVAAAAEKAIEEQLETAPVSFREDAIELTDDTCVAWIMWSSGDYSLSYSVGDTYTPDSLSPGIVPTDVLIDGAGKYTVALDFTGTAAGYSDSVAFSAIGISNGELIHPGWAMHIEEVKINGEAVKLAGRPYTCSDDGRCTRTNLYNAWVTDLPAGARVLYGPNIGCSATPLDVNLPVMSKVKTIEITFLYEEKK